MNSVLIRGIKSIVGISTEKTEKSILKGKDMSYLKQLENAYILIENGLIHSFGPMDQCPDNADIYIDAHNGFVLPAWCDSHTHIVFAGSRENEWVARLEGQTYAQIAQNGGGILNSAKRLTHTDEDELFDQALMRFEEVMRYGTGAIEIKSGYGLTLESEIKMLKVIRRLKALNKAEVKATFLGAHAIPSEFKNNRQEYIRIIIEDMLPLIAAEGLADYCDVFCDEGFYTEEETDKILNAASKYGLKPKIHANELAVSGGVQVGVKNNAISVDHLEAISDVEIECLMNSKTIPTVLPFVSFFLNIEYAPARRMIDRGLGVCIASDYNPGSSPCGNIPLLLATACNAMRLLPEEAINAATINGAYAMEVNEKLGTIKKGKQANLIITKPLPSVAYLTYAFGTIHIDKVLLKGRVI